MKMKMARFTSIGTVQRIDSGILKCTLPMKNWNAVTQYPKSEYSLYTVFLLHKNCWNCFTLYLVRRLKGTATLMITIFYMKDINKL